MVWHLPPDSALARELSGGWSTTDELLAMNAEISYAQFRTALASGGVKKHRLPRPLQIPRPKPVTEPEPDPAEEQSTADEPRRRPTTTPNRNRRRHATTVEEVIGVLAHGFGPRR